MIKIGSSFQLPVGVNLDVLDTLPTINHKYGDPQPDNQVFHWMKYTQPNGYISFARNLGAFMPEVARYVVEYLAAIIDEPVLPERVNFMKTRGTIGAHRDEGGRRSAINIGVRNSSAAFTRASLDDNFDTFDTAHEDHLVENGCAYILNVGHVHAVIDRTGEERLLITVGFGLPARELQKRLR